MRETSTDEQTKRNEKRNTNIQQTISKQASAHFLCCLSEGSGSSSVNLKGYPSSCILLSCSRRSPSSHSTTSKLISTEPMPLDRLISALSDRLRILAGIEPNSVGNQYLYFTARAFWVSFDEFCPDYSHVLQRFVIGVCRCVANCVNDIHPCNNFSKNGIVTVQTQIVL